MPNKLLSPEKFAHRLLLLFFLFRDEKQLLSGFHHCIKTKCKNKESRMLQTGPHGDFVDQAFSQFNENYINNQDSQPN